MLRHLKVGRRCGCFYGVSPPPVDAVEEVADGPRDDPHLLFRHADVEPGAHRVRLSGPRLAVRQHGGVVALEAALDQMAHRRLVDAALRRVQVITIVESEGLVLAQSHLRRRGGWAGGNT